MCNLRKSVYFRTVWPYLWMPCTNSPRNWCPRSSLWPPRCPTPRALQRWDLAVSNLTEKLNKEHGQVGYFLTVLALQSWDFAVSTQSRKTEQIPWPELALLWPFSTFFSAAWAGIPTTGINTFAELRLRVFTSCSGTTRSTNSCYWR